jgi:hypothetical protein
MFTRSPRSNPLEPDLPPQQAMLSAIELVREAVLCAEAEASEACTLLSEARRRLEHAEMTLGCGGRTQSDAQEDFLEF